MATHLIRLLARETVAADTCAFHFEKPSEFNFKPGQYVSLALIDPPESDDEGTSRSFSIASAPFEPNLMFATRMRDTAMKRVLRAMPIGTEVKVTGPFGNFTLDPDSSRPAVLLAGGIGITPFRSISVEAAHARLPNQIRLFISNHTPDDAAFLEELRALEHQNPNFKLIATITSSEQVQRPWQGEHGRITPDMLKRYLKDLASPIYYIAGPPGLVAAMREVLEAAGIDSTYIHADEFTGY
jgi:ferredoxin-NADP reductase